MRHALVIDPDLASAAALQRLLAVDGYTTLHADRAEAAARLVAGAMPAVVCTELALPDADGLHLLATLQLHAPGTALVVVTADARAETKIAALDAGADDYLVKPVVGPELLARVRAVLRRAARAAAGPDAACAPTDWMVDHASRCVRRGTLALPLRPKEYDLLCTLWARRGEIVSRGELLRAVWGYAEDVTTRTVDSHIFALRRKLEPTPGRPRYILTVNRAGYRLVA